MDSLDRTIQLKMTSLTTKVCKQTDYAYGH